MCYGPACLPRPPEVWPPVSSYAEAATNPLPRLIQPSTKPRLYPAAQCEDASSNPAPRETRPQQAPPLTAGPPGAPPTPLGPALLRRGGGGSCARKSGAGSEVKGQEGFYSERVVAAFFFVQPTHWGTRPRSLKILLSDILSTFSALKTTYSCPIEQNSCQLDFL